MSTHTPGPWYLKMWPADPAMERGEYPDRIMGGDGEPLVVSCITGTTARDGEPLANARLIAAAPELVEPFEAADNGDWRALDLLLGHSGHGQFWRGVFTKFRAALDKAEGRS